MTNQELFETFEEVIDELKRTVPGLENKADKLVINEVIKLIDSVAWQYEEEQ
ncbi:hypothetical protein ACUXKH_000082 [Staphylococcus epidermidis]|uniref:hypothetical protein n=1 Tax=Staphylococcus lugdunensis TaxID=28035 RepID=UPI001314E8FF|nr:hypothetical protein [Staphylococcus lugdunensis]MCH8655659.1 hypothetical protein [Staphylococcus lugdunensis]